METKSVGLGGLVVVSVAVALSTTLLPALLAVLGRQIDRPRWLARRLTWYHAPTAWEKWARSLVPQPAACPGGWRRDHRPAHRTGVLDQVGLPSRNWWPTATEAGQGVQMLDDMGVSNIILPVRVMVEVPQGQTWSPPPASGGCGHCPIRFGPIPGWPRSGASSTSSRGPRSCSTRCCTATWRGPRAYPDFLDAYLSRDSRVALIDVSARHHLAHLGDGRSRRGRNWPGTLPSSSRMPRFWSGVTPRRRWICRICC